uniref:Pco079325 n=1 Tax=Arundo donax TaxID=35708 RepID=A0A0A9E194_ARUDO
MALCYYFVTDHLIALAGSEADEQTASGDPQIETFVDRPPTTDGLAEPPICQICMRPVDVIRRRNAEASVRVTNLSMDTRECDLVDLFCPFGLINHAYLAVDEKADSSTRFGIVDYDQSVDAEKAISWLNGFPYDNLILQVEWATPRQ